MKVETLEQATYLVAQNVDRMVEAVEREGGERMYPPDSNNLSGWLRIFAMVDVKGDRNAVRLIPPLVGLATVAYQRGRESIGKG